MFSSSHIVCVSPSNSQGFVQFEVLGSASSNSAFYQSLFLYQAASQIFSADPSFGSIEGGTVLLVYGANLKPYSACQFSTTTSASNYISSSLISCIAPPAESAALIQLTLSHDDGIGTSWIIFRYDPVPRVYLPDPSAGPGYGGLPVTIHGENFANVGLKCRTL